MKDKLVPSFSGYSSKTSIILWAISLIVLIMTIILGIFSYKAYSDNSVEFFITTTRPKYELNIILTIIKFYFVTPLCLFPNFLTLFVGIVLLCSVFLFLFLLFGKLIIKQSNSVGIFFTNQTILFIFGFLFASGEFLMNLCKPKDDSTEIVSPNQTVYIFGIVLSGLSFLAFFFTHYSIKSRDNKIINFLIKKIFLAPMICFQFYYLCYSIGKLIVGEVSITELNAYQDRTNTTQLYSIIAFILFIGLMTYILKDFIVGIIGILLLIGMVVQASEYNESLDDLEKTLKDFFTKSKSFITITQTASIIGIIILVAEIIFLIFKFKYQML
jgi:hypothetical protein